MFDPNIWVPFSDDDARAVSLGQKSSIEFVVPEGTLFMPITMFFSNEDTVLHDIRISFSFGALLIPVHRVDVPSFNHRLLVPQRTLASSNPPVVTSTDPLIFGGPCSVFFVNNTAAAISHSPQFISRWVQTKSRVKTPAVKINRTIT